MRLGVVAALETELKFTLAALPHTPRRIEHLRFYESSTLVFVAGGVGARPAAAAAVLMADHFKPDALISAGFCGALGDELDTGDLILGGTRKQKPDEAVLAFAKAAAPKARTGLIRTVEKVVLDPEEKKKLREDKGALAIDMEAEAVALAARSKGVGFLSVKAVIDTPSEPLASSYAGCWTVLKQVLLRPGMVTQMMYDSRRVKIAAERLKEFFVALKEQLHAEAE
jgi:nucleoside phosphorylase